MHHPSEAEPEDAVQSTATQTESNEPTDGSRTPRDGMATQPFGEYVRLQTEMTNVVLYQFKQSVRAQSEGIALMQRLFDNVTQTMFDNVTRTMLRGAGARKRGSAAAENHDPATREDAEQDGDNGTGSASPVVRETPDGSLAFKQWRPQQLSLEPPEHDRQPREARQPREKSERGRDPSTADEQKRDTSTADEEKSDDKQPNSDEPNADDEQPDPAADMF